MTAALAFDPEKLHKFEAKGACNTSEETVLAHVRENIRRGLPQVQPYPINGNTAVMICGGPSINTEIDNILREYWAGGKVVAVNGAYNWCIDHNIKPSAFIMLDAREWNSRFLERDVPGCKYFLASQCHPSSFDACYDRETYIWHACSYGDPELEMLKEFYFGRIHPIGPGTTVALRSIILLRTLGFAWQHIFGMDSCWIGESHHGYDQPENKEKLVPIWLRPEGRDDKAKRFECAPWHVRQATDFMQFAKTQGNIVNLNVHGPGLIAEMLRTGCEIQMENDDGSFGLVHL